MQGFRHDAHPMGMLLRIGRRAVDLLPGRQRHQGPRQPRHPDDPPDRQDADAGRLRLPPRDGHALRLSGQRPALPGQLPRDDVQDDRAEVRARSAARAGARHPLHPARRPRAELLDQRRPRRRLLAGRPLLGGRRRRRRRCTARCTAAPTRRSCGCCTRIGDKSNVPELHRGRQGRQRAPDGLRPPRLQELRPAREDHQAGADDVFEVTGVNPLLQIALELEKIALEDELLRLAQALPERRLLLGPDLRGARAADVDVPGACSRSRAPRAGSRSGWRWSRTPSRRSRARARSTRATRTVDYVPMAQR